MKRSIDKNAFSLPELLVVLVIIGIHAATVVYVHWKNGL